MKHLFRVRARSAVGSTLGPSAISAADVSELKTGLGTELLVNADPQRCAEWFAEIVTASSLAQWVVEIEGSIEAPVFPIRLANLSATSWLVTPDEPPLGMSLEDALTPAFPFEALKAGLVDVARTGNEFSLSCLEIDGQFLKVLARPLSSGAIALTFETITDVITSERRFRHEAEHDTLTGLVNRTALHHEVEDTLERANPRVGSYSLVMLDLNQFKEVNDALGHVLGDAVLQTVAARLQEALPDYTVARLGGDEFAVFGRCDPGTSRTFAADTALACLEVPLEIGGLTIQTHASAGVSYWPDIASDSDALFQQADVAMYLAKGRGGGCACYDSDDDESSVRRVALLGGLHDAASRGEFELWYQPIYDLQRERVDSLEALIRWRHPKLGLVMPGEFIELAEISGSIRSLTRWVLTETLRSGHRLAELGLDVGLACNLSARNLYEPEFVDWVEQLVAAHGLPAGGVRLELTETDVMTDPEVAFDILTKLGRLGFKNSIDDFGTGYSSLAQLRDLPMDVIKIDRSFVSRITIRDSDATIVQSVVQLGAALGLKVVAEGVEDQDTLRTLKYMGCDMAQGYLLGRPEHFDSVVEFLGAMPKGSSVFDAYEDASRNALSMRPR